MIKYYPDGRPKGITYTKAKGKRPMAICVVVGKRRTSISVGEGMDFYRQWEKAINIVMIENGVDANSMEAEVLLDSYRAFLRHYNLMLEEVKINSVRELK